MSEYECEVCGIVHVDDDGNEWTDDTDDYPSITDDDKIAP